MNGTSLVRRMWMMLVQFLGTQIHINPPPPAAAEVVNDLEESSRLRAMVEAEKDSDNAEIDRLTRRLVARDQTNAYGFPLVDPSSGRTGSSDRPAH